ncbi:MAG: hypothetical protein PVI80_15175 [Anaerolineae bacterium]|jgi:hypothetical protein
MISTVTTTTVTTVAAFATGGALAVVGILMLLTLLVQKELSSASESRFAIALNRVLNIAIVPLLLAFVFIVGVKVFEALQ